MHYSGYCKVCNAKINEEIEFCFEHDGSLTFKFGDVVINEHAGDMNPQREGIFVRSKGLTHEFTDGKGNFWDSYRKGGKFRLKYNAIAMKS